MKYKLAIFDFDGTLADSFPFFLNVVNELAEVHKFRKVDIGEIETLRGYGAREMLNHVGLPLWRIPSVARSFKTLMAKKLAPVSLFAGAENMLHGLSKNGVVLGLITSNSYDNVRRILSPYIMNLMAYHECGTSLFGKQSRLRNILRKAGVQRSEVIYIGDEIRDLEAANAENIAFGAVSWGYTRADALIAQSPTEIFSCIDEIVKKLA